MFRHKYGLYNPYEKPIQGLFEIDPNHPMSQYLGAYWPLNGSRFDKKNQYNLTLGSALTWAPTGLNFPGGANSTTKIATFPSLNLGTVHTVCCKVNILAATVAELILAGAAGHYAIDLNSSNQFKYSAATGNVVAVSYTQIVGQSVNLAITRSAKSISFFVNGGQVGATQTLPNNYDLIVSAFGGYSDGTYLTNEITEHAAFFNIADINIVKQMHADPYAMLRPIGRGRLWSVSSVLVTKDSVFPVDLIKNLSVDKQFPVDLVKNLSVDKQLPVNLIKGLSVDNQFPVDLIKNLSVDKQLPVNLIKNLSVDKQFPVDFVKKLQITSGINIQSLKWLIHDDQIIIDLVYGEGATHLVSVTSTFSVNVLKTIAQNSEIPFDFIDGFLFKAVLAMMSLKKPSASMSLKKPSTSFDLIGD